MEQTTQQIIPKPTFPILTRIAAWWLMTIGAVVGIISLGGLSLFIPVPIDLSQTSKICGFLSFVSGYTILGRKKWAWWLSVIILSLESIFIIRIGFMDGLGGAFFYSPIFILPLILLLLDRENFFKIAS
jgi:ABC-type xylose transport system permease subunit